MLRRSCPRPAHSTAPPRKVRAVGTPAGARRKALVTADASAPERRGPQRGSRVGGPGPPFAATTMRQSRNDRYSPLAWEPGTGNPGTSRSLRPLSRVPEARRQVGDLGDLKGLGDMRLEARRFRRKPIADRGVRGDGNGRNVSAFGDGAQPQLANQRVAVLGGQADV